MRGQRITLRRAADHLDRDGSLKVAVWRWLDPTPVRPGWEPQWVNVNLAASPVKVITYRRKV